MSAPAEADRSAQGDVGQHLAQQPVRCALERAYGAPRERCRVPARLQDGAGGNCLKEVGIALSIGPSPDWLKFKNPDAPVVRREAEEQWGR